MICYHVPPPAGDYFPITLFNFILCPTVRLLFRIESNDAVSQLPKMCVLATKTQSISRFTGQMQLQDTAAAASLLFVARFQVQQQLRSIPHEHFFCSLCFSMHHSVARCSHRHQDGPTAAHRAQTVNHCCVQDECGIITLIFTRLLGTIPSTTLLFIPSA